MGAEGANAAERKRSERVVDGSPRAVPRHPVFVDIDHLLIGDDAGDALRVLDEMQFAEGGMGCVGNGGISDLRSDGLEPASERCCWTRSMGGNDRIETQRGPKRGLYLIASPPDFSYFECSAAWRNARQVPC